LNRDSLCGRIVWKDNRAGVLLLVAIGYDDLYLTGQQVWRLGE